MTDAPKIDTTAPERIGLIESPFGFALAYREEASIAIHYIRADLADASAAAAVEQAFRDGLTYATNCHLFKRSQFDEAWERSKARSRLGDASAALDRLIAERVREAFTEAANIVDDPKMWGLSCDEIAAAIRARGSKEGQS